MWNEIWNSLPLHSQTEFLIFNVYSTIIIIIITLFQEGDIYITIVNHDGPQNKKKEKKNLYIYTMQKNYIKNLISLVLKLFKSLDFGISSGRLFHK